MMGDKIVDGDLKETRDRNRDRGKTNASVSPALKKLEQADKFFGDDDKSLDTKTELDKKQVYGIAALRSLDSILKVKRVETTTIDGKEKQVEVLRGGLPGTMMLCNEVIKLNISLNRNSRKERVEILKEGSIYYNRDELRLAMERGQAKKGITQRIGDYIFGKNQE